MKRTASIILFLATASLLVSRLVSPASSAPEPRRLDMNAPDQTPPALAEVNSEVARLRDRLTVAPARPSPSRDPFSFGRATERAHPQPAVVADVAPAPPVPPRPALPRLVAILSPADADASAVRTAVLVIGDDVQMKKAGDDVGVFRIEAVSADALVVVDRVSRAAFTVALH